MAAQGKDAVGADQVTAGGRHRLSNGEHGALCEQDGITAVCPCRDGQSERAQYFSRDRFQLDRESDSWRCPAGATLTCIRPPIPRRRKSTGRGVRQLSAEAAVYRGGAAGPSCRGFLRGCAAGHASPGDRRSDLDEHRGKPPNIRLETEMADGPPPVPAARLKKAKAELALGVLCYNLKRVINILGVPACWRHLSPPGPETDFLCCCKTAPCPSVGNPRL